MQPQGRVLKSSQGLDYHKRVLYCAVVAWSRTHPCSIPTKLLRYHKWCMCCHRGWMWPERGAELISSLHKDKSIVLRGTLFWATWAMGLFSQGCISSCSPFWHHGCDLALLWTKGQRTSQQQCRKLQVWASAEAVCASPSGWPITNHFPSRLDVPCTAWLRAQLRVTTPYGHVRRESRIAATAWLSL